MIDIVIVNWNSGNHIVSCIESIKRFGDGLVANVIVIDNGSIDGSDRSVEKFEGIQLIRAGENLGFGKACNLGAKQDRSKYLLFLNPDAELGADTLKNVVYFMEEAANSDVGICGVQLLDEAGLVARSCARFPSVPGFAAHSTGLEKIFPRFGHRMSEWDHDSNRHVDQVIGAFFFVRRSVFEKLGGFDERFFVYFEEVDFSYRASVEGWSSFFLGAAKAHHTGGGTSNQVKAKRLFYSLRSRILYSFKHFSFLSASSVLFMTLFFEPLSRSLLAIIRRSWAALKETWCGYGMLWSWLSKLIFSRGARR
ncbi:MAG: glycosyltransferase family 2 protein [Pseudomonadota bacterium]